MDSDVQTRFIIIDNTQGNALKSWTGPDDAGEWNDFYYDDHTEEVRDVLLFETRQEAEEVVCYLEKELEDEEEGVDFEIHEVVQYSVVKFAP